MLVTLSEILNKADKDNYAVVAPDFTTMETIRYQLEAAEANQAPVILSYAPFMAPLSPVRSWKKWIRLIREESELYDIDVCLHMDHGRSFDDCRTAVDAGFTGVMIDASDKSYAENVDLTCQVVEYAQNAGVSVEAEIGHVGFAENDDSHGKSDASAHLTQPDQAEKFVRETDVDALAVAVGTVHGIFKGTPKIDFDILAKIDKNISIPLVLHGGSGTGEANIRKAVSHGICKVNVFTDWIAPTHKELRQLLTGKAMDAVNAGAAQQRIIHEVLTRWFTITSSAGKCASE